MRKLVYFPSFLMKVSNSRLKGKRRVVKPFLGFLMVFLCICSVPTSATIVSFDMDTIFEGPGVPANPPPWMNITFDDGGTDGTVDLTISAPGLDGNNEKVSAVYINLDAALDPTQLVFSTPSKTGSFDDPVISLGVDAFHADGDGLYDILFDFHNDGLTRAFNGLESVQYTITLDSLTANSFDFTSSPDGGVGEYYAAAHILGLGETEDSAWITPEPTTITLLGLGSLVFLRKRRI
ncbi:MAG: PEP-CTERM sorting domain-containing protein [Planctomycetota bacterium]|jgi:hypothetical protein